MFKKMAALLLVFLITLLFIAGSASAMTFAQRLEQAERMAGLEVSDANLETRIEELEKTLGRSSPRDASLAERLEGIEWDLGITEKTAAEGNPDPAVSMLDLTPFSKNGVECFVSDTYCEDSYHGQHDFVISPLNGFEDKVSIEYLLDDGYKNLQGVAYIPQQSLRLLDTALWERAGISIYGDDRLLWSWEDFEKKSEPIPLSIDITGTKFLRIDFSSAYRNYEPLILLGDMELTK